MFYLTMLEPVVWFLSCILFGKLCCIAYFKSHLCCHAPQYMHHLWSSFGKLRPKKHRGRASPLAPWKALFHYHTRIIIRVNCHWVFQIPNTSCRITTSCGYSSTWSRLHHGRFSWHFKQCLIMFLGPLVTKSWNMLWAIGSKPPNPEIWLGSTDPNIYMWYIYILYSLVMTNVAIEIHHY